MQVADPAIMRLFDRITPNEQKLAELYDLLLATPPETFFRTNTGCTVSWNFVMQCVDTAAEFDIPVHMDSHGYRVPQGSVKHTILVPFIPLGV